LLTDSLARQLDTSWAGSDAWLYRPITLAKGTKPERDIIRIDGDETNEGYDVLLAKKPYIAESVTEPQQAKKAMLVCLGNINNYQGKVESFKQQAEETKCDLYVLVYR
jgi:hypothetical protein